MAHLLYLSPNEQCKALTWSDFQKKSKVVVVVLWHCCLGYRTGIRPVKSWVLICWWWQFDWSFARLTAPVVTTTSVILASIKIRNGGLLESAYLSCLGKWPLDECRVMFICVCLFICFFFVPVLHLWLGGRVVRTLDLRSTGHGFESWPHHCWVQPWASG